VPRIASGNCRQIALRDGRRLAYAEYGSAGGKPIILCHGTPSSRVEGDLIIDAAVATALGLWVIVPDRPGIGCSDFQPGRRIVDWPTDVTELAAALDLDTFAVLGSSGGAPYAAACGALIPERIRTVGLMGGIAPADAPGVLAAMNAPLRIMMRLARFAPALLRGLFRLNLRAMQSEDQRRRAGARMAASVPEPDRTLFQRPEIRDGFMACFQESCRQGPQGPVWDEGLMARPWGFDLAAIEVNVLLWQGERDGNVPALHGRYLASAIPGCRATFYPDDAHLSVPLNHQREILSALAG
jgi:pimeloyl-ACP methyl ester carboxylesterase